MTHLAESKDQLQAYQARLLEVAELLTLAFDRLHMCPPLALDGLHPNRRAVFEDVERNLVECNFLCRTTAQCVYYFDEDKKEIQWTTPRD